MKRVFISREQHPESFFKKHLEEKGFAVFAQSLVAFSACPVTEIPEAEWVFFYSKRGIQFFFEAIQKLEIKRSQSVKYACIGEGTAKALSRHKIKPDFVGTGQPDSTAAAFLKIGRGKKVLFPQALNSRQSIQYLLADAVESIPLVVYENKPLSTFEIPECDFLVFTSPMNAEAYYGRYALKPEQKVIAIGQTTGECLRNLEVKEVFVADEPSEKGLVDLLIKTVTASSD